MDDTIGGGGGGGDGGGGDGGGCGWTLARVKQQRKHEESGTETIDLITLLSFTFFQY